MFNYPAKKDILLLASFAVVLCVVAFAIASEVTDADDDRLSIGDTVSFGSGSGKVVHNDGQDVCTYNTDSQVIITMTVLTKPAEYNKGWDDVGTLSITDIEFKANSDLVYIPPYIVDKIGNDIGLYKIVSVSDSVKSEIDGKTVSIVLPRELRSISFGKNVTVLTEGSYTDTKGNVVHYSIDETSCAYMNGYGTYSAYANVKTGADLRYCEQGTVTKVDYAAGQNTYDTKMVRWCTNDLTSNDKWVCGLGAFGDMIGTVLTYELEFTGKNVKYSVDSLRCATNAVVSISGNTLKVNAFTVTAEPKQGTLTGWNISDGDKITSDMEITADRDAPQSSEDTTMFTVLFVIILIAIAGAVVFMVKKR